MNYEDTISYINLCITVDGFRQQQSGYWGDNSEPQCRCDIKMLVSYGHEKHCAWLEWKRRIQSA